MTPSEFIADMKAKAAAVESAIKDLFAAHPDIESEAASIAKSAVDDLSTTATAAVEKEPLPPEVHDAIDTAIASVQAKADADVAAIKAEADAKVASLQAAKGVAS